MKPVSHGRILGSAAAILSVVMAVGAASAPGQSGAGPSSQGRSQSGSTAGRSGSLPARADDHGPQDAKIGELLRAVGRSDGSALQPDPQAVRLFRTPGGYVSSMSCPRSGHVEVRGAKGDKAMDVSDAFVRQWRHALIPADADLEFKSHRVNRDRDRSFVRYRQTYKGLEVHAATLIVQTDDAGGAQGLPVAGQRAPWDRVRGHQGRVGGPLQ